MRDTLAAWLLLLRVTLRRVESVPDMGLFHNSRHWTVTAPLLAIWAALSAAPALAQTSIKFTLDGKIEGPVAPFVVAVDKGSFKAQGLEQKLKQANVKYEFYRYKAKHAFANETLKDPSAPIAYNASAAEIAWARTMTFLKQHVG